MLHLMFFLSLPVSLQSAVVTTTGTGNALRDILNISHSSNISNISNIIPLEILNQEIQGESDEFKDLVSQELKNLEIAEEQEKKKEQEKLRIVAQEKALLLWHKKKEKGKANAEAEHKRQEQLKIQAKQKCQKEIAFANECKQYQEKLKNELRSKIQLKCQKEKEMLAMKEIRDKFAQELEIQVCQEMGLPTSQLAQLPCPMFPHPTLSQDFGSPSDTPCVTPSSILSIKKEKFDQEDLTDPQTTSPCGDKWKDPGNVSPAPSAKCFATKQDLQQTFTPSRKGGKSSCTQLFSPLKSSGESTREESTLEI